MQSTLDIDKQRRNAWLRFIVSLALGSTLNPINSTMISTALVPIADYFHASVAETGWLIAGLYLTSAIAQPTMGRLADIFGPRRVYLICLFVVALAGLVGGATSSLGGLVVVRVLLGIGTSGAYPSAMRIVRVQAEKFGSEPPAFVMGMLSMGGTAMLAIGPFLGGLLTSSFGWHSIFTVNAPFALAIMVLAFWWIPRDERSVGGFNRLIKEVDLIGIGLFTVFLLSLMVFLLNLDYPIWIALLLAILLCFGLVRHSTMHHQPFIDLSMLVRNRALTMTYLRAGTMLMMVYCILYGFAQWLESAAGFSEKEAGLMTMPMSVIATLSSLIGTHRNNVRVPFLISMASAFIGCICLMFLNGGSATWAIAIAVAFFAAPQGMFSTATQTAVYMQADPKEIGTAAGLQRTAQYIGAIAATSLLGLVYGKHATDGGLHHLALVMGSLSALLFVFTMFDRTLSPQAKV